MASEVNNFVGDNYMSLIYVLDSKYDVKYVIDTFTDLLWTERYCGYGEFEITIPYSKDVLNNCQINDYISIRESDVLMIVDTIGISSDVTNGTTIKISGQSLECLLDRRIIVDNVIGIIASDGTPSTISVQEAIRLVLTNNMISAGSMRNIPGFTFKASTDSRITRLNTSSFQERGTIIYDKILKLCQDNNLGFRINAKSGGGFEFELYFGTDRSLDQTSVPAVIFSTSYENLLHSDYLNSIQNSRNTIYVDWKYKYTYIFITHKENGVVDNVQTIEYERNSMSTVYSGSGVSGLARRETYMNDGTVYDAGAGEPPEFITPDLAGCEIQVARKGREELALNKPAVCFEGDVQHNRQFVYGIDYFLGDIVQLENEYGINSKCRITEVIRSRNGSGVTLSPTFKTLE